ncbi:MAG: AAA family ATPase [Candidatus Wallbacteria bacterium]|nr:AAA family ATPase [Candidatus Wallbacteria bacterium]
MLTQICGLCRKDAEVIKDIKDRSISVVCERCGDYIASGEAWESCFQSPIFNFHILSSYIKHLKLEGKKTPVIKSIDFNKNNSSSIWALAETHFPKNIGEQINKSLLNLRFLRKKPGESIKFDPFRDLYLTYSEKKETSLWLIKSLEEKGLIKIISTYQIIELDPVTKQKSIRSNDGLKITISADGEARIEELERIEDNSKDKFINNLITPFALKKLSLVNYRCFESLDLDFDSKLTVLVADNGGGKTAVLDAIATCVSTIPEFSGMEFSTDDVRLLDNGERADSSGIEFVVCHEKNDFGIRIVKRNNYNPSVTEEIEGIGNLQKCNLTEIIKNLGREFFAYYKTDRSFSRKVELKSNTQSKVDPSYLNKFIFASNESIHTASEWFYDTEDRERRKKIENHNGYEDPTLRTIKAAIIKAMPEITKIETEIDPKKSIIVHFEDVGNKAKLRIDQLSDGFKMIFSLVLDLSLRLTLANPDSDNSLNCHAVVMIDEIDLHLHPSWQQRVLTDLQRTFPNVQFIVTTHSPQVLSTVPKECIRIIKSEGGKISVFEPFRNTHGEESKVILEDIFDTNSRPPGEPREILAEYLRLVDHGKHDTEEATKLRKKLEEIFGENYHQLELADIIINRNLALKKAGSK